jgi:hypothetical protein
VENSIEELRKKWKDGGFKTFGSDSKNDKLIHQLQ